MKIHFYLTILFVLTIECILGQSAQPTGNANTQFPGRGVKDYYVDGIKICCFNGLWIGSNTEIILNSDSTFNLEYSFHPTYYRSCGHWTKKSQEIILTDFQDHNRMIYELDCKSYTRKLKDTIFVDKDSSFYNLAIKGNIWTVFDENNKVKLKINGNKLYWTSRKIELKRQTK